MEIAVGYKSGKLKIIQIEEKELKKSLKQHNQSICSLIYSPNNQYLYSLSTDVYICVYSINNNYCPLKITNIKSAESIKPTMILNNEGRQNTI